MDNKQWKWSCYSNYSKWQQSPRYPSTAPPSLRLSPPLMSFLVGCMKSYAVLISTAQASRDLFFTMTLLDRIIHLLVCVSTAGLPHSATALTSSSAKGLDVPHLRHLTEVVTAEQILQSRNKFNGAAL